MKIVHVIHTFPPHSRAGSENYVEALVDQQRRRHEVSVFHRIADSERPEFEALEAFHGEIPVVTVNRTFGDMTCFRDTYVSRPIEAVFEAFLERERPDVVHFHHVTCLSTTCVQAAHRRRIPVIFTLHDFWLICPRGQLVRSDETLCEQHTDVDCVRCMAYQLRIRGGHDRKKALWKRHAGLRGLRFARRVQRWLASRRFADQTQALAEIRARVEHMRELFESVDHFISPSAFLRDQFIESGLAAEKISVLDNGFDTTPWRGVAAARVRSAGEPLRCVYLGTWIPTKGVHVLLEAFRELDPEKAVLDVHGYAVPYEGREHYEGELRSLAEGAANIRLGERYTPAQVPQLLAEADVLVVPSVWYENSPLTLHEAFLAGLPVIASDHGGLREFVQHEVNGLRFKPGSVRALRAAITRLIDEPELLGRLRARRTHVMSIDDHAQALDAIYAAATPASAGVSAGSVRS
ncbi:MAG: glycosyltransferase family 4 protein [Deltaproteobacteria bacterium]|nr:glycosyltransferase family 4 protein [Deltaproteobacteria bacterium]MBW2385193.1 glycosyltransferase family 4 protein [Deltaproteobacteria bacterium]